MKDSEVRLHRAMLIGYGIGQTGAGLDYGENLLERDKQKTAGAIYGPRSTHAAAPNCSNVYL